MDMAGWKAGRRMKLWTPRAALHVRLHKVTENRLFWVFFFRDPVHHFIQSAVVPKTAPWESVAEIWETMHKRFMLALKDV